MKKYDVYVWGDNGTDILLGSYFTKEECYSEFKLYHPNFLNEDIEPFIHEYDVSFTVCPDPEENKYLLTTWNPVEVAQQWQVIAVINYTRNWFKKHYEPIPSLEHDKANRIE